MRLEDITIEVRNKALERQGLVQLTEATCTLTDAYSGVGSWELTLPLDHPMTPQLRTPGAGIVVTGFGSQPYSGPVVQSVSRGSAKEPEGLVTFRGVTDEIVLDDALAYPVPESPTMEGQTARPNDVREGAAETVMHGYVNANIGPGAPAERRAPGLVMGTDQGRGVAVHKTARFPKLVVLLREIGRLAGVGFRVTQRGAVRRFETYEPIDRRRVIRMDMRNNTLSSYELISAGAIVTHAIVAGQEEGVERQLVERTTEESLEQAAAWGRRKERFLDRRSTGELPELEQAGDELLKQQGIDQSALKFVPMDEETMVYGADWGLGDVVTAVVEGREVPAIVTAAVLKIDSQGVRIGCALGDLAANDPDAQVRSFMSTTDTRLSALERTAESMTRIPADRLPEHYNGGMAGEMRMWAGPAAPNGWALCDGRAVSRSDYAALFAVLGTTYGTGNGTTTFNLPDLRGRTVVMRDTAQPEFAGMGATGGEKAHELTVDEMPAHSHTPTVGGKPAVAADASNPASAGGSFFTASGGVNTLFIGSAGGGEAHNNLQPYMALNYIIKL